MESPQTAAGCAEVKVAWGPHLRLVSEVRGVLVGDLTLYLVRLDVNFG